MNFNKYEKNTYSISFLLAFIFILTLADINTFINNTSNLWSDPLNWSLGYVPLSDDQIIINATLCIIDIPINVSNITSIIPRIADTLIITKNVNITSITNISCLILYNNIESYINYINVDSLYINNSAIYS